MTTVSFIIPIKNAEKTLEDCLNSILNQRTDKNITFEILPVLNNSSDNSQKICEKLNLNCLFTDKVGAASARNEGLKHSKAKYVAFMDADVVLNENWLSACLDTLSTYKFVGTQSPIIPTSLSHEDSFIDRFRKEITANITKQSYNYLDAFSDFFPLINTAACLYQRSWIEKLNGFDEDLIRGEDRDLTVRLFFHGANFAVTNTTSAKVYWDSGAINYLLRYMRNASENQKFYMKWGLRSNKKGLQIKQFNGLLNKFIFIWVIFSTRLMSKSIQSKPLSMHFRKAYKNSFIFQFTSRDEGIVYGLNPLSRMILRTSGHIDLFNFANAKKYTVPSSTFSMNGRHEFSMNSETLRVLEAEGFVRQCATLTK